MFEVKFNKQNKKLINKYCSGIYAIRNDLNNHMYVGSSSDIRGRYGYHLYAILRGDCVNKNLLKDIDDIGLDKFSFLILEECEDVKSTLKFLECKYIDKCGYYNICSVDGKPVYCYTKSGEFVREYSSLKEAAKDIDGFVDNIRAACDKRKKSYKNYQWSFIKTDRHDMYTKKLLFHPNKCKPIVLLDMQGNEIRRYRSIHEASDVTGITRLSILDFLRGRRKQAGGYKWSYINKCDIGNDL